MQIAISAIGPARRSGGCRTVHGALDHALCRLTDCNWDPSMLARHLPELVGHAATLSPSTRSAWLYGLDLTWRHHGDAFDLSVRLSLLELAAAWSYWPLAIAVGVSLEPSSRLDDAVFRRLCEAYCIVGDADAAIDLAVAMQLAHPARASYTSTYRRLLTWRRWRADTLPMTGLARENDALYLEPLAHQHCFDFEWQYYDPAIADLCCLPRFDDPNGWHDWLDEAYARDDLQLFAVMHRRWGFIGSVALVLHGDVGLVYYWIGRDYRGAGFGPNATALLLAAAHRHAGMRCCYAKVFDYNAPSRRALEKIGFVDTGIRAAAPYEDQLFYRIGNEDTHSSIVVELHALMDHLESDVQVALPLMRHVA